MPYSIIYVDSGTEFNSTDRFSYISGRKLCGTPKNHFHMGLDFRTENKENIRIIAVEDGYISRMVIAPNGYGKAIYIHHPQLGFTSVYAHLNAFRPDMEWWINQAQYARQLNAIDTSFAQAKFL